MRIGINGLGRIGRGLLKELLKEGRHEVALCNDVADGEVVAHLLNYDSYYGPSGLSARFAGSLLHVGQKATPLTREAEPHRIPWKDHGVEWVVEATGRFKDRKGMEAHGLPVILTASSPHADRQVVFGVNHRLIGPEDRLLSATSCTTHSVVPPLFVLTGRYETEAVLFNTVHCYNVSQTLVDAPQKDLRRARAAALNLIPTTTSASLAVEEVLPELRGKTRGMAVRVPAPAVSMTEITLSLARPVPKEEALDLLRQAAAGDLRGILALSEAPLVSQDFLGHPASSIVDAALVQSSGRLLRVVAWYDNEFGYVRRLVDLLGYLEGRRP